MVISNTTSLRISGNHTIEWNKPYEYFWVRNNGTADVLMSVTSEECESGTDGVITVPSGASVCTMHNYPADKLYLKGDGIIQVFGSDTAFCPASGSGSIGTI